MGVAESELALVTGSKGRGVGPLERWLTGLAGLLLLGSGVRQRGLLGLVLGAGGLTLAHLALSGEGGLYSTLGLTPADAEAGRLREVRVQRAITIHAARSVVFQHWRRVEALARTFAHVERVERLGAGRTYWVVKGPGGTRLRWVAEVTAQEEDRRLAWRTLPGSDVHHHGEVRLCDAPGAWGTEVRVDLVYEPPAGRLGEGVARVLRAEPRTLLEDELRHIKQLLETGEVATNARGPAGHRTLLGKALASGIEEPHP